MGIENVRVPSLLPDNWFLKGFGWAANPADVTGFAATPSRAARQDEAIAQALGLGRSTLSESESKELLAAWGVQSARERRANSAEAAVAAAEELGFPVALKVDSSDILHKTEAGVVRLNLGDAAQVRTAYAEILARAKAYAPQARITGVSVQEIVTQKVCTAELSAAADRFGTHNRRSALAAGTALDAPKPTFGPGVPLGRHDSTPFFKSPALDSALQPKDDPFGTPEGYLGGRSVL